MSSPRKKVLLVVVDALASDVILPAMESGKLPTFASLAKRGSVANSTAIFPSITPAATASIVTGCYPQDHGIAGAYWWNEAQNTVSFFGADLWVIFNQGPGKYFRDFMVTLNETHLKKDPIFQSIEHEGLTGAVINFMWFRGDQPHEVNAPFLIKLLAGDGIPETVNGPTRLALADFVPLRLPEDTSPFEASAGLSKRHGFHDEFTEKYLRKLFSADDVPDFSLAYFPNNDFDSHEDGPSVALETVQNVDRCLSDLFDEHGGIDAFLDEYAVVVTGDHSQSETLDTANDRDIALDELLGSFRQATPGKPWQDDDQIFICPNLRAAQIYTHPELPEPRLRHLIKDLLAEKRIDQVIIRSGNAFEVITADRSRCCFHLAEDGNVTDAYGNRWSIVEDLSAIDAKVVNGQVQYGDYPNALERIASGFADKSASLWVTARLGHEFRIAATHTHPGGSHGSLHHLDSTSPLIAAGLPDNVVPPPNARTIDIAPLCRQILLGADSQ